MTSALDAIRQATRGTEYEYDLYLVGGVVRDELLGLPPQADIDLVTTGPVEPLVELLRPISSIAPVVYERFGTAMLRIDHTPVELVRARKESYEGESRKPQVEPATLEDDARRRDFTANALMRRLADDELIDPTGRGLEDLRNKTLRTPLEPGETFRDDPLRMLRAVRFRWKLLFEPAPGLFEAIAENVERLRIVSEERIRDELRKMMLQPTAPDAFADLMRLGLLDVFAPELRPMVGCEQGHWHHLDVWEHSLLVLRHVAGLGDETLSWAALLHDIAKPETKTTDAKGHIRFFGHEEVGARLTESLLRNLRFSTREIEPIARLVRNHMRLGSFESFTPSAARRLIRDMGDDTERLLTLVEADASSLAPGVRKLDLEPVRARLQEVRTATPAETLVSPLSGKEIMTLTGLPPGEEVGRIKTSLTEAVLDGRLEPGDTAGARELVGQWVVSGD
jgi:poly(A) polymerase